MSRKLIDMMPKDTASLFTSLSEMILQNANIRIFETKEGKEGLVVCETKIENYTSKEEFQHYKEIITEILTRKLFLDGYLLVVSVKENIQICYGYKFLEGVIFSLEEYEAAYVAEKISQYFELDTQNTLIGRLMIRKERDDFGED